MGDLVFISHAMEDAPTARLIAQTIEANPDLRCWIAPRNVSVGEPWASAIERGVDDSRLLVVLLSEHATTSPHVAREVALAAEQSVPIWPIRLDEVSLTGSLKYYLAGFQTERAPRDVSNAWLADLATRIGFVLSPGQQQQLGIRTVEPRIAEAPPPRPPDPFRIRITRNSPGCILILVDCSNSMHHRLGGSDQSRRAVVANSINTILRRLEQLALGDDGVRPYFDVGVLGYGVGDGASVSPLIDDDGKGLVSIADLSERFRRLETEVVRRPRPNGMVSEHSVQRKVWITPTANQRGRTVALTAFSRAHALAKAWVATHQESPPPIVVNITDGGYDEGEDPEAAIRSIQELSTIGGNAVVFNCHLSDTRAHALHAGMELFPSDHEVAGFTPLMQTIFYQSSVLPEAMQRRARDMRYEVAAGARGYAYNADSTVLMDFLEVGTVRNPVR